MKLTVQARNFLAKNKGDREVRKFLNKGGRKGVLEDFNKLLIRASRPARS